MKILIFVQLWFEHLSFNFLVLFAMDANTGRLHLETAFVFDNGKAYKTFTLAWRTFSLRIMILINWTSQVLNFSVQLLLVGELKDQQEKEQ